MKLVASYALFGNHVSHGTRQFYWDHLPSLVRAHHNFFPAWELRIHVDNTYKEDRSKLLRAYAAAGLLDLYYVEENIACCRSMLWRMRPAWDPAVDYVICRDIDSMPCPKDALAVEDWINSGAAIHTINDNPQHTVTMMGGMVGFKVSSFLKKCPWPTWEDMITRYEGLEKPSGGYDQMLMSNMIWNLYCPDICSHRFAGMPADPGLRACFTSVEEPPMPWQQQANALMRHLGACSYDIPAACKLLDSYGNPKVRDRVLTVENIYNAIAMLDK
jgi:hypothetical protein